MVDTSEKIAGIIGMGIVSLFLLGLAESIGHVPFWIIVVGVLAAAWYGYYEECLKKPNRDSAAS